VPGALDRGRSGYVNVSQGQTTSGNGTIWNGQRHTFPVRVQAAQGVYQAGNAQGLTFANVEHAGIGFSGVDESGVQLIS
jgi:hypothetical protein